MTVRVGHIPFLNCYPLYHGLGQRGVLSQDRRVDQPGRPGIALLPGVPTELNRWLVDGDIDLGPISSIAYARNYRRLLLSRHVSISSRGAVDSIQLVTKVPLKNIRSVALSRQSATSVALLKTIFKLRLKQTVAYGDLGAPLPQALTEFDAVLVIGDQGLEAMHFPLAGATCHDLGALWQEWTGLPMVFAVWAAREDFAHADGPGLLAVERELVRCMDYGRDHLDEVVEAAAGRSVFGREILARYFGLLRYDFTGEYQEGLRRFYELAYEAGELEEPPQLRFIDDVAGEAPQTAGERAAPPAEAAVVAAGVSGAGAATGGVSMDAAANGAVLDGASGSDS